MTLTLDRTDPRPMPARRASSTTVRIDAALAAKIRQLTSWLIGGGELAAEIVPDLDLRPGEVCGVGEYLQYITRDRIEQDHARVAEHIARGRKRKP